MGPRLFGQEGVLEELGDGPAFFWIPLQALFDEVDGLVAHEGGVGEVLFEVADAEVDGDFGVVVELVLLDEGGPAGHELVGETAEAPDVGGVVVLFLLEDLVS